MLMNRRASTPASTLTPSLDCRQSVRIFTDEMLRGLQFPPTKSQRKGQAPKDLPRPVPILALIYALILRTTAAETSRTLPSATNESAAVATDGCLATISFLRKAGRGLAL
jgi:hypothetical protein